MPPRPTPLIGLSVYRERARTGVWDTTFDLLPADYSRAVEAAGGIAVLLPPILPFAGAAAAVVARLDGLLISGGADVDPATYDAVPHPSTGTPRTDRDAWEFALLDAAAGRGDDFPVLGICRGMQVMAVHAGGVLDQHVPDLVHHTEHSPGGDVYGRTEVRVRPGSALADAVRGTTPVACHHHQSVREHPGFEAVAHAPDGVLEAIEDPTHRFRVAVQWHPEVDPATGPEDGVVAALVAAARRTS